MIKHDFIGLVASKLGSTEADAGRSLKAVLEAFTELFEKRESLILSGFGSFGVKERSARSGRNPKTGEAMAIASSRVAYFKPSATLKALLNPKAD